MTTKEKSYLIRKTAITLIEEEAGKPIESIPQDELLGRVDYLTKVDFRSKGIICISGTIRKTKHRFRQLISEGKFIDHINEIKNPKPLKKPQKRQISIDSKRRVSYETKYSILKTSESGLKKTRIMYKNNLSFSRLETFLDNLSILDLLEYNKEKKIYTTTDLGLDFIYVFKQLRNFLSGESTDEPVKLDGETRELAISALRKVKRKTIYDYCALVLGKASEPTNRYNLSKFANRIDYTDSLIRLKLLEPVDTDKFQTTPKGLKYIEEHLNFILFNYLG